MSDERMTPEERAVVEAAEKLREGWDQSRWLAETSPLLAAVDALRASRKRWKVEQASSSQGAIGGMFAMMEKTNPGCWLTRFFVSGDHAERVCDLLNAAEEQGRG